MTTERITSFTLQPTAPRTASSRSRDRDVQRSRRPAEMGALNGSCEEGSSVQRASVDIASTAARALHGRAPPEPWLRMTGGEPTSAAGGDAGSVSASRSCAPLTPSTMQ